MFEEWGSDYTSKHMSVDVAGFVRQDVYCVGGVEMLVGACVAHPHVRKVHAAGAEHILDIWHAP